MSVFIQPRSRPWIEAAEAARAAGSVEPPAPYGSPDAAAEQLRDDYGRVSRWLWGIAATVVASIGILFLSVGADFAVDDTLTDADRLAGAAFGVGLGLLVGGAATGLLVVLHRTGRRLAIGLGFWVALPYRTGRRTPETRDYFVVRFLGFEPYLLIRIITSALAFLAAAFTVSLIFYSSLVVPSASGVVIGVLGSILFVAVMIGQFGGVQRIQAGYAHRDPWWDSWRRSRGKGPDEAWWDASRRHGGSPPQDAAPHDV